MQPDLYGFPRAARWPQIDAAGMAEVDALMSDRFGITLPQMMENAGRALAIVARDRFFGGNCLGRRVTVMVGAGGNGGGVLTAARSLAGWGAGVAIVLAQGAAAMTPVAGLQLAILRKMGLRILPEPCGGELILDGLIGHSLRGAPQGRAANLIGWANADAAPVLSLDVPSGFDAQTGKGSALMMRATATLTLALPKRGLSDPGTRDAVGDLYLADISVPPQLYEQLTRPIVVPPFAMGDILRLEH